MPELRPFGIEPISPGDGTRGEHLVHPTVGHHPVTGLQVPEGEESARGGEATTAATRPVGVEGFLQLGVGLVLTQIAKLVPPHADETAVTALVPQASTLTGGDLPDRARLGTRVEVLVEEGHHLVRGPACELRPRPHEFEELPVTAPGRGVGARRAAQQGEELPQVPRGVDREEVLGVVGGESLGHQRGPEPQDLEFVQGREVARGHGSQCLEELGSKEFPRTLWLHPAQGRRQPPLTGVVAVHDVLRGAAALDAAQGLSTELHEAGNRSSPAPTAPGPTRSAPGAAWATPPGGTGPAPACAPAPRSFVLGGSARSNRAAASHIPTPSVMGVMMPERWWPQGV